MNTDIRLSVEFFDHPKTVKLKRRLGYEGIFCLQRLWVWAAQNRSSGMLCGLDVEGIEIASKWEGEEGKFVSVLEDLRFLDREEGVYALHNWGRHQEYVTKDEERRERGKRAAAKRWGKEPNSDAMPDACRTHANGMPVAMPEASSSNAPSPALPSIRENTLSTHESLVNQDHARALNVAGDETGEGVTPKQVRDGTGDEPSIEFAELREFWDRECRAEGPLTGWQEYKQLKAARQWPGMGRIAQDVAERYASGAWEKGWAKALGNYLRERYWLAEAKAGPKKQPRASPRAPTEHQRRLTEREVRAQKLLEQRGMKPQGEDHEHVGHHCGQAVDVEHRVRDIAL